LAIWYRRICEGHFGHPSIFRNVHCPLSDLGIFPLRGNLRRSSKHHFLERIEVVLDALQLFFFVIANRSPALVIQATGYLRSDDF
jgi:hypothetical protein